MNLFVPLTILTYIGKKIGYWHRKPAKEEERLFFLKMNDLLGIHEVTPSPEEQNEK